MLILALNIWLLVDGLGQLLGASGSRPIVWFPLAVAGVGIASLLIWFSFEPLIAHWVHGVGRAPLSIPEPGAELPAALAYRRILVPLDHTELDRKALRHASAMAKVYGSKVYLLHVEEGVDQPDLNGPRLDGGGGGRGALPGADCRLRGRRGSRWKTATVHHPGRGGIRAIRSPRSSRI